VGKSAVLKDLFNHVAGYVVLSGESVLCRAQLNAPATLNIVFSDGTHGEYDLDAHGKEQRFSCEEKNMRGCYVFQKEELCLISDEAMRRAFEEQIRRSCAVDLRKRMPEREMEDLLLPEAQAQGNLESERTLPQRRWPPPPCWDGICYRNGCWQEE